MVMVSNMRAIIIVSNTKANFLMGSIQEREYFILIIIKLNIMVNFKMAKSMELEFYIIIQKKKFMRESSKKVLCLGKELNITKKEN